jgi:hypothetical protein
MSSISATINGTAKVVDMGTEEEAYYKEMHLENNTFAEGEAPSFWGEAQDGGREMYIEGEEVRVVVVRITDGRVSDWKGGVRDWSLSGLEGEGGDAAREAPAGLVNGVV